MTRAAIYIRVSTEDQVDGLSLDVQRSRCEHYIRREGWEPVGLYADQGVSGMLAERPALDRLLGACRAGHVDAVVVSRLDRFGRSVRHLASVIGQLDELRVRVGGEAFDSTAAAGRLQRDILSSIAQFEREEMLERMACAQRAKVQAGWWPGGPPPFGFTLERVGRHDRLILHPEAAIPRSLECRVGFWPTPSAG